MPKVIGLFRDMSQAEQALDDLKAVGYDPGRVDVVTRDRNVTAPEREAGTGDILITVDASDDDNAASANLILRRAGAEDVTQRQDSDTASASGKDADAAYNTTTGASADTSGMNSGTTSRNYTTEEANRMSDRNAPYSPDQPTDVGDAPPYADQAVTGASGYGAGETGSINRGSERTGVSTGPGYESSSADDNAASAGGAAQNDVRDLGNAEAAGQALGNSGAGASYSEANATAGELINSDQGYATGYAGSSGADEARGFRTSSDPEYGERSMGYDDDSGNF